MSKLPRLPNRSNENDDDDGRDRTEIEVDYRRGWIRIRLSRAVILSIVALVLKHAGII